MWNRATFVVGLGVGLVVGMRMGRERYEQLKSLTQKVSSNPSVQKAAKTASQKAGELTKAAGQQAAGKLPRLAESAKAGAEKAKAGAGKARASAEKVKTQLGRNHDEQLETAAHH